MPKNIIIFTAHPDDHLVFGGTVSKLSKKGFKVHEILFTDGERAPLLTKSNATKKEVAKIRLEEFEKAHKILGISTYQRLKLENGNIQSNPKIIQELTRQIRQLKPVLVLTLHNNDYHPDHIAVSNMTIEAVKTANISNLKHLGSAHRVPIFLMAEGLLSIKEDIVIDISETYKNRQSAEKIYESQITPRMRQWGECFSGKNGYLLRAERGEAFEIPTGWPADISQLINL